MRIATGAWRRVVCALAAGAFVAAFVSLAVTKATMAYGVMPGEILNPSPTSTDTGVAALSTKNLSADLSRWKRDYSNWPPTTAAAPRGTLSAFNQERVPLIRLTRDVLAPQRYDVRARPVADYRQPLKIHVSMSLYQIIDVNEPSQNIKMNVWMIQKWRDESLDWDPRDYAMINTTILPHNVLWVPDTYLYNSVVMSADETERYMNIRADSLFWEGRRGANMSFLYPAIYTVTCRLNIRYFPYDQQNCTLTIGSWTNSKSAVDYEADDHVNMASFIPNEEWDVMSFRIFRHEYKYACCPEPWVILEASIILRRKPLYYVINLIIPTSIITLVAVTGFFTPASTSDDRTEKINLGITTLLAMSILMLMVSDAMPTTSEFVPLIAWFYLSIIIIISIGTFLTSVLLGVQSRRQYGELPPRCVRRWILWRVRELLCMRVPPQLALIWDELDDHPINSKNKSAAIDVSRRQQNGTCAGSARPKPVDLVDENAVTLCGDSARVLPPVARRIRSAQIRQHVDRSGRRALRRRSDAARVRLNWQRVIRSVVEQRRLEATATEGVPMIDTATPPYASPPLPPPPSSLATGHLLTPTLPDTSFFEGPAAEAPPLPPRRTSFHGAEIVRQPSSSATILPRSRQNSTWEMAMNALGMTSHRKSIGSTHTPGVVPLDATGAAATLPLCALSPKVAEMHRRRQCSLEWEFIATILDRVFLILFTFTVLSVTAALMITGQVAQAHYESG